ncbi:hypothetical protein MNV49_000336 [Pseudohyphozyma bogoriensis]|nr:hypothetical protein MNV49_000336 [Pseudohyphozyma bogoriensis]
MVFRKEVDSDSPREIYGWRLYLQSFIIDIGTTIVLPSFKADFGLNKLSASKLALTNANIVSTFQCCCFFGAIFAFPLQERVGRKISIQIATFVFIIGALIQTVATSSVGLGIIYAGRALVGLGVGVITAAAPVFLAEISVPAVRGRLIGLYEISYQIGAVVGFWINYGIQEHINTASSKSWRISMGVQLIPAGLLLIGSLFLKETPRLLLKMGKKEQALEHLSYLRQLPPTHPYILQEVDAVEEQIAAERAVTHSNGEKPSIGQFWKGVFKEVCTPGIRNRFVVGFFMMAFQNMVGTNAINYYSTTIFKTIGVTNTSLYTGIYGVIKAAASVVFLLWLIDTWGRRQPLLFGAAGSAICMFYLGIYNKVGHPSTEKVLSASTIAGGKAATAAIMIFGAIFCLGWNGLAWVICAEIYPLRLRSLAATYTACCQWLFQFIITRTTPTMELTMGTGAWGMFILFGMFCVLSGVFAYFCVPETKGRSLEDMDDVFGYVHPHQLRDVEAGEKERKEAVQQLE